MLDIPALKDKLRIPEAWARLGLPGKPGNPGNSPFRKDIKASFCVYDEDRKFKDQATGCSGDVIGFVALACNIENAEAIRRCCGMVGESVPIPNCSKTYTPPLPREGLQMPSTHRGSFAELEAVAQSRHLTPETIRLAEHSGILRFGRVSGFPCWILTDPEGINAEARRVDGMPFPSYKDLGARKAHSIRGSNKTWPVGLGLIRQRSTLQSILFCEGAPDVLAALQYADQHPDRETGQSILPVGMLGRGTGHRIHPEALKLLVGKRVRLYPHADDDGGGVSAAKRWAQQLHASGCEVDIFSFDGLRTKDGGKVKDLNDSVRICDADQGQLGGLLP